MSQFERACITLDPSGVRHRVILTTKVSQTRLCSRAGEVELLWRCFAMGRAPRPWLRLHFSMRSILEDIKLDWPKKTMGYGAQVLSQQDELLDALPDGEPLAAFS